jgi:PAS domain S-box-containing protein
MLQLMNVMDVVPFPVFIADEDMYYVYENQAAEHFLGYDRAAIIGKRITDLVVYDPRLTIESFEQGRRTGHISGRVRYRHRDGTMRDADVNAFSQRLSDDTTVMVSLLHPLLGLADRAPRVLAGGAGYGFTSQEMRLLQLIADGFCDESIATILDQAPGELADLVRQVLAKMKVGSRTEAAIVALKKGILL